MLVRFKLLNDRVVEPRTKPGDAGADLYATHDCDVHPQCTDKIRFGVAFEIPSGYVGLIQPRSGLASHGRIAFTGVIDSSYRGEVCASVHNTTRETWRIKRGDRVAQLVIVPCPEVELDACAELSESDRGARGFGSSGR